MNTEQFDDETLMAFADGELDDVTSRRVEEALETDEALAERLAVFLDTRTAVASAMKPLIDEPVPDALEASVRRMAQEASARLAGTDEGKIVSFRRPETPQVRVTRQQWLMPVAASILAVVTGIGGFMAGRSIEPTGSFENTIAAALDGQASGSDVALGGSDTLHIIASFVDGHGDLCREYELRRQQENTATVACRMQGKWVTRLALSSPQTEGYVPASSQEMIDAYLTSIEAGEPLAANAEKDALAGKIE